MAGIDKRYQVFVSSTYEDLQPERQEVMRALLELDCIPSGMELFPAASEDQWTVIKRVIDDCDYYIVIVAGKYGSTDANGQSYTEKEYRYALEQDKPIIAFLHKDPSSLPAKQTEQKDPNRKNLGKFRAFVQENKLCKFWESAEGLGSVVSRSLVQLIKNHPAVGWVRADLVPDESAAQEILRLRDQIMSLESTLARSAKVPPPGTQGLAQGDEQFIIELTFSARSMDFTTTRYNAAVPMSWNEIFACVAPCLLGEADDLTLRRQLQSQPSLAEYLQDVIETNKIAGELARIEVSNESFDTIKVQLRALGLITQSPNKHGVKDTATYWTLTPYGDEMMTKLRAIRRETGRGDSGGNAKPRPA